jgi:beta-lactam-binding protein with PASTA domain
MLPASFTGQEVSLNVTSLEPGTYWFSVLAQNSLGVAYRRSNILDIPPVPPGACPTGCPSTGEPYKPEIPPWVGKVAAEQAAQAVAEYQAKQRQAAKEQEEQQARAAALRSAEDAAFRQREAEGHESSEPTAHPEQRCVVPALRGLTLSTARRALSKAHCRFGRISRPTRHQSVLVIVEQSPRHGKRLAAQAQVSVKLLAPHHRSG